MGRVARPCGDSTGCKKVGRGQVHWGTVEEVSPQWQLQQDKGLNSEVGEQQDLNNY